MSWFVIRDADCMVQDEMPIVVTRCHDCKHYQNKCCVRYGKQEHPGRNPYDFCSRAERRYEE